MSLQTLEDLIVSRNLVKNHWTQGEFIGTDEKGNICNVCATGALFCGINPKLQGKSANKAANQVEAMVYGKAKQPPRFARMVNALHDALPQDWVEKTFQWNGTTGKNAKASLVSDYNEDINVDQQDILDLFTNAIKNVAKTLR